MKSIKHFLTSEPFALYLLGLLVWLPLAGVAIMGFAGSGPIEDAGFWVFLVGWFGGGLGSLIHAWAEELDVAYQVGLTVAVFLPKFVPVLEAIYWIVPIALPLYWITVVVTQKLQDRRMRQMYEQASREL